MEISDSFTISLSLQEIDSIIREKIRQILRDTGRHTPTADHNIELKYRIDHNEEGSELNGVDIDISLPWETENL